MNSDNKLTTNETEYLKQLLTLGQTLNSTLEPEKVLHTAIESVVDFVRAERGFIMLFDEGKDLIPAAFKNFDKDDIKNFTGISKTIIETSSLKGDKILSVNAQVDPRFKHSKSVQVTGLRSVMCVPLKVKEKITGVIYVDTKMEEGKFNHHQLNMLDTFSNQAGIAIENAKLHENLIKSYEEQLRLKEELHEQEKKRLASEEANRLKSEFVNIVTHELRSPMTVIKSYSSLLYSELKSGKDRIDDKTKLDIYGTIDRQITRLVNMINKQLDTSRIDAGKSLKVNFQKTDLKEIIEDILKLQKTSVFFLDDAHSLEKDIEENLPDLICDREKITQILYNLVENGLKYSPKGGPVTLKVYVQDNNMYFSISDKGIGISEEGLKKLFKKFERVDLEGHTIPGTGLGLYLIKHLVELHNGTIEATSKKGEGSTFSFKIPINLEITEEEPEDVIRK